MRNREKFFVIFTITIIFLSVLYVVTDYVGAVRSSEAIYNQNKEMYNKKGEIKEQYSSEIEKSIQNYLNIIKEDEPRDIALLLTLKDENFILALQEGKYLASMTGIIDVVFYSFVITIFIYAMLTLEYKNKKQYLIAQGIILVTYWIVVKIEILVYGFREANIYLDNILPIMYLIFLTGNSIKNKKEILLLNVTVIDAIVVANVIYTSIIGTVDISWNFTIGVYMPILAVECIVILIEKCIKSKAKKAEKN